MSKKLTWGDYLNYFLLGLFAFLCFFPFFYVLSTSFTSADVYIPLEFNIIPKKFSLESYLFIAKTSSFVSALTNSVLVTLIGTVLNVLFTFTGAYGLSKASLPGYKVFMALITFTLVFNAGIVPNYLIVKDLKLINTYWAIIIPILTNAWSLIVVRNFMIAIPKELEEAATIDGCNDIGVFLRVIIPLSLPALATFALFFAVGHWNSYFNTMLYITDTKKWTLPLLIKSMIIESGSIGYGSASSIASDQKTVPQETIKMAAIVLSILPIVVLYPFLQKYFVKGVMIGAVKG
jgi:putative aldouronate transport system permease protein